jgi:hypothetical protein
VNWYRKLLVFGVALALTVGTSCTAGELPLGTEIEGDGGSVPPGDGGGVPDGEGGDVPPEDVPPEDVPPEDIPPGDDGDLRPRSALLRCEPQPYATATAVVGPGGGQISIGAHSLTILENALSEDVTITGEQIEGEVNSVRFSPEGLHFAIPAVLTLSYQNCANVPQQKHIVFTDEVLLILESLPSLDLNGSSEVQTVIDHFSRYAVAY